MWEEWGGGVFRGNSLKLCPVRFVKMADLCYQIHKLYAK